MGLGSDALDQIGDVRRIAWQAPPPGPPGDTPAQAVLADLHWDGFMARARDALVLRCCALAEPHSRLACAQRTASDELYHATWANASGVRRVLLPLPARVLALNTALQPDALDERAWLAQLHVRRSVWDAWQAAVKLQEAAAKQ
jgi:hypothetical protein